MQEKEIEELKETLETLRTENDNYQLEKDQVEIERDRLEISLQKTALGIDIVDFDNRKLQRENRILNHAIIYQQENEMEKQNNGPNYVTCNKDSCSIF